jgi:hypothetical protein
MLDRSPNRSSGSQIGQFLKATAFKIRTALKQEAPDAKNANDPKLALSASERSTWPAARSIRD